MYDPSIARFSTIDPIANNYRPYSPYHYALNNPIRYIDFQGMGAQEKGKKGDPPKPVKVQIAGFTPRYSGSPVSISGTLKGKWLGGKIGYASGNKEFMLSGNVVGGALTGTVSGDGSETKGKITILTGEMKAKVGDIGLAVKGSAAEGEATINDKEEVATSASAGNVEGELGYDGKGASISKSAWTSKSSKSSNVNLVGGDNKVGSSNGRTTVIVGASAAEVSVTVNHDNTANFISDLATMIQRAIFGDELKKRQDQEY